MLLNLGTTTVLWLIPNIQPATALSIGGSQRWRQAVKAGGARTGFGAVLSPAQVRVGIWELFRKLVNFQILSTEGTLRPDAVISFVTSPAWR